MEKTKQVYLAGFLSVLLVGVIAVWWGVSSYGLDDVSSSAKAAPSKTFLSTSTSKTKATDKYSRDCSITIGRATSTQTLTSDEQAEVDAFNAVASKFKVRIISTTMGNAAKKIYTSKKRTNADGTLSVGIYADAKGIYYPGSTANTWKGFYDQATIDSIFESVKADDVTSYFKNSKKFVKWDTSGKAIYSGKFTSDGNTDFISNALGQDLVAGQDMASVKLYIDEKTQLWSKYEATIDKLKSGKVTFRLKGTCKITYGNPVKVNIPTNITWVDAETGTAEMIEAMSSVY